MARHDRIAGDLLEQHPMHRHPLGRGDLVGDVPGDRLAFPVGVGGEVDGGRGLGGLLELGQRLGLALDGDVLGLEPVVDVHAQLPGGEIAQVPDRRLHVVAPAQVLPDGLGLGGRLDDDERISHAGHGLGPRLVGLGLGASGGLPGRLLGLAGCRVRLGGGCALHRAFRGLSPCLESNPRCSSGGQLSGVQERRPTGGCKEGYRKCCPVRKLRTSLTAIRHVAAPAPSLRPPRRRPGACPRLPHNQRAGRTVPGP